MKGRRFESGRRLRPRAGFYDRRAVSDPEPERGAAPGARCLSVVVVTHNSREAIERSLPPLVAELRDGDELIVVDNQSSDGTAEAVSDLVPSARVVEQPENVGYGGGCNVGAALASGDLLLFLNPDATVRPGFRDAIEQPLGRSPAWAAWQGLVTSGDGTLVNSTGGVIHFTGIAWAGGDGLALDGGAGGSEPRPGSHGGADVAPAGALAPRPVAFASGTCLAVRRERWHELGGFPADFFLYHEDVDLSLRLRLAGHQVGIEPGAVVDHTYEFGKGPAKWRQLERNRWATLIRTYPTGLIAVLLPALLATELALLPIALAGGWLGQKLRAWIDLVRAWPRLIRSRREVQATRTVSAAEFAGPLNAELDSQYLGAVGRSQLIGGLLRAYWFAATLLLGRSRGAD
jgi:hypothetical protein